jgi:hypothetical protein
LKFARLRREEDPRRQQEHGTSTANAQPRYAKKLGILTPRDSAIAFTMKFGALPM